jgi:hypothetical protein
MSTGGKPASKSARVTGVEPLLGATGLFGFSVGWPDETGGFGSSVFFCLELNRQANPRQTLRQKVRDREKNGLGKLMWHTFHRENQQKSRAAASISNPYSDLNDDLSAGHSMSMTCEVLLKIYYYLL